MVMVVVTLEGADVSVHIFCRTWDSKLMLQVFLICSEHLLEMLVAFLAYKAVMQDGVLQTVHLLLDICWTGVVKYLLP